MAACPGALDAGDTDNSPAVGSEADVRKLFLADRSPPPPARGPAVRKLSRWSRSAPEVHVWPRAARSVLGAPLAISSTILPPIEGVALQSSDCTRPSRRMSRGQQSASLQTVDESHKQLPYRSARTETRCRSSILGTQVPREDCGWVIHYDYVATCNIVSARSARAEDQTCSIAEPSSSGKTWHQPPVTPIRLSPPRSH